MQEQIPFTDIYVGDEILERVSSVLRSKRFVKGVEVEKFEEEFATENKIEYAVGVSSGTAAMLLALRCLDIKRGDDVFVPGHTFFATVSPALFIGANPIFVDIDPQSYTMDVEDLKAKIHSADNPAAIIPVHLYGYMADMNSIKSIADTHDLDIIEDACQAHFATRGGNLAGTIGNMGVFSFYPSKNMTVGGDGGMIITNNEALANKAKALRNHGRDDQGNHRYLGLNHRLDETSATFGRVHLKYVKQWNEQRNSAAQIYSEELSTNQQVKVPHEVTDVFHVYHLYVIQVPDRESLRKDLKEAGIETGVHYETPLHQHQAVKDRNGNVSLNVSERIVDRIVSLPMHPRLTESQIKFVCTAIQEHYA